jgi:predicted DNA-binding ribbon-helix-helix protein
MNAVCKALREKYATIDSKVIYEEVGRIAKGMGKSERKENKFWDKLKDIKPRLLKI